jgi:hypothetical protein
MASVLVLCAAILYAPASVAQQIQFELTIKKEGFRVDTEPMPMDDAQGALRIVNNATNEVTGMLSGACLGITAPENITIIVRGELQMLSGSAQTRSLVSFDLRYINDGEACPADLRTALGVSSAVPRNSSASFVLHEGGLLSRNRTGIRRRTTGFLYIVAQEDFSRNRTDGMRERVRDPYLARYVIDIEYL